MAIIALEERAARMERAASDALRSGERGPLLITAAITRLTAAVLVVGEILKEPALCGVELKLGALVAVLAGKEERR
jgi:hypothetical protein